VSRRSGRARLMRAKETERPGREIYLARPSAKLNGSNPEAYLREVLERVADHPREPVEQLLPWNVGLDSATTPR
jgi:hypothetical protein